MVSSQTIEKLRANQAFPSGVASAKTQSLKVEEGGGLGTSTPLNDHLEMVASFHVDNPIHSSRVFYLLKRGSKKEHDAFVLLLDSTGTLSPPATLC